VYTFGKGSNGQLGHGNRNDCSRPTKVRHLAKKKNKIRFIAAGFDQTFCISSEGEVYSFGKAGPWLGYGTPPAPRSDDGDDE
jgi:alpha-tubulin suppressor-like RCC1 family protein